MNNEAAKLILQAYRSGGQDSNDPQFREALAHTQRDPELARWFANEQALDARISAKLGKAIIPPPNLKAQLFAQQKIVSPVAWWQRPATRYALAACFTLLITVAALWSNFYREERFLAHGEGFAGYRNKVADFAGHKLRRLEFKSADVGAVRRWLAQNDSHADLILPAGLEGRPSLGCRVLDWRGHKVTLVCFELENRQVVHLLAVDRHLFPDAPGDLRVFQQVAGVATSSWSQGDKTYIVACKGGTEADLLKLFNAPRTL